MTRTKLFFGEQHFFLRQNKFLETTFFWGKKLILGKRKNLWNNISFGEQNTFWETKLEGGVLSP